MEIRNAGYNHCHDTDFIIDRPSRLYALSVQE